MEHVHDIRDVLQCPEAEDWQARLERLQTLWRRGKDAEQERMNL